MIALERASRNATFRLEPGVEQPVDCVPVGAFMGDTKKFNKPVSVELVPGGKVYALGFVTRESLSFLGMENQVAVYMPQSYNFAGNVLLVPTDQVQSLSVDSSAIMTFVVSGGVSGPEGEKKDEG